LTNAGTVIIGADTHLKVTDFYEGEFGQVSRYRQTDGRTVLSGGTLTVTGTTTVDGGQLSGHGLIHGDLHNNGQLLPGASGSVLNLVGHFTQTASGSLAVDLTGSDRPLRIGGSVSLDGSLVLTQADQAPLRAEFVLLDNDGSDAISGSLVGLPEGAALVVGGEPHVLTYAGGAGNDLSLRFPLAVVIQDASAPEGDSGTSRLAFRVTLPRALSQEVAIGYATEDGTALAPFDYLPAAGTVRIPAGETEAWIDVLVVGDTAPAAAEVFFVRLTNVGVYLDSTARHTAVGTIVNDDNRPFQQTGQFVFTSSEDFHEGRLLNLTATATPGRLQLDPADLGIFPFVNVPASGRGTVIRIDVRTGEVVGEYITAPGWIAPETSDEPGSEDSEPYEYAMGRDPSRTTVDLLGNVWVTNRAESSEVDGVPMGSVTRIGIVVGGTRGNKVGLDGGPWEAGQPWQFAPDPDGQYLQGPFQYSTAVDRDGDGLIRTSRGLADVLSWSNAEGVDSLGGVSTADDELIITYTRTRGTAPRTVAVDRNNDAWVGGTNLWHELLSGETGLPVDGMHFNRGAGGYGGLVDGDGVLWSTRYGDGLIRFVPNPLEPPGVGQVLGNATGDYGIGLDPATGHLWHSSYDSGNLYELDPLGNVIHVYQKPPEMQHLGLKGVVVDGQGHVWVAGSGDGSCRPDERVWHLAPDPTATADHPKKHVTVGVVGGFCGIHGVAVDGFGKVWVPERHRVSRIDPQAGQIRLFEGHGIPVGAVDLSVDIGQGARPYTYSDMTGFVSWNTFPQGTWTHTVDAEHFDALWYMVSAQGSTPEGSSIELRARASNDRATLDLLPYTRIASDQILREITGRYLQVQATLRSPSWAVIPALEELVIHCVSVGPSIRVDSPPDHSQIAAGTSVLIAGQASAGHHTVPLAAVMIDGAPVDALDASGAFFTRATIAPGQNEFQLTAIDVSGRTATTGLTLIGVPDQPQELSWATMTDSAEFTTKYHRTSFHDRTHVLYADLELTHSGPFALEGPMYLGITNISHPAVHVAGASGVSREGIAYFDFSHLVGPDGIFSPGETTDGLLTLSFYNPQRVPFTYELVLVGEANRPPQFTSVPQVSTPQHVPYRYLAQAQDPDGHPVHYRLTAAPAGMTIDPPTGQIIWSPAAQSLPLGNHGVTVEATDGFGGAARQSFTLSVQPPAGNRPPVFRSIPVVAAAVSEQYVYHAAAFDPDGDPLVYSLAEAPAAMEIELATGLIRWTPAADQVDQHLVRVAVSDGQTSVEQQYQVRVLPVAGNHRPTIVSQPVTEVLAGSQYRYQAVAVDPDRGDVIGYSLLAPAAPGLQIDPQTGLIVWTAPLDQTPIRVQAADGRGGYDLQEFVLTVTDTTPGSITGRVFHDVDGNGRWDGGEPAIAGRVVYWDRNQNRRRDADEPWSVTDASGQYVLGDRLPGTYTVAVEHTSGWLQTAPADSVVVIVAHTQVAGPDFGLTEHIIPNSRPYFTSTAPTVATVGVAWDYTAVAEDPDQDPLDYTLAYGPDGMAVERFSGQVVWTPASGDAGIVYAGVRVSDGRGGSAVQSLALAVSGLGLAPVFTSRPVRTARLGQGPYAYDADAEDPIQPAAPIRYWLDQGSLLRGMTVDADTGLVQWSQVQAGQWDVTVWASNPAGQTAYQWYRLLVTDQTANHPPQVGSDVVLTIPAQVTWYDRVPAWDPDDDPLTFTLADPAGISGLAMLAEPYESWLAWTPTAAQVNDPATPYEFHVQVSDGQGHVVQRSYRINVVADVPSNRPPAITSSPRPTALVAEVYAYQAAAVDPEGHAVHWQLEQHPPGMMIDDQTGLVLWAPTTADLGSHRITVVAIDAFGAVARQPYTLSVSALNRPPYFTTAPRTWATVDQPYAYAVGAKDPDGQPLGFELAAGPVGASIQPQTGLVTWLPQVATAGAFSIRVVDPLGLDAVQNFTVDVQPLPPNQPPFIRNAPQPVALVGKSYEWLVDAVDPDHPASELTFSVSSDPPVACLNFASIPRNRLVCELVPPGIDQAWVTVAVADPLEAVAERRYLLTFRENQRPSLLVADRSITAGQTFAYDVPAADADPDDVLAFSLSAPTGFAVPAGMTIDPQLGRIRWPGAVEGSYPLRVSVSDGIDAVDGLFTLRVLPDNQPPDVTLSLSHRVADVGQPVWIWVIATDDVGVTGRTLTIDGQTVPLDDSGAVLWTVADDPGHVFTLQATARDAAGNVSLPAMATLRVRNPDNQAPRVTITSPTAGATVTERAEIVGSITDPDGDLVAYTISITPLDSPTPARTTTVTADPGQVLGNLVETRLGWLDATLLANGTYRVDVWAMDVEQRVASDSRTVEVQGNLKLGNFTLTFVDLQLPAAGLPITITRTYDTLEAHRQADFGYGWRMDIANVQVDVVQPGNDQPEPRPFLDGDRIVFTLPDGKTHGFTFYGRPVNPRAPFADPQAYPAFQPDAGSTSSLRMSGRHPALLKLANGYDDVAAQQLYNPASGIYGDYELTLRNGTQLAIDSRTGQLRQLVDRTGNRLTFTPDGIQHSAGRHVGFTRDYAGRITEIVLPDETPTDPNDNPRIRYEYDGRGDLVAVTDRSGATTRFTYLVDPAHYLDTIIDPLGRPVAKTEYDEEGRVAALVDAAGNRIETRYDVDGRTQSMTDPLGFTTTQTLDDRGNVIREIDPTGVTVKRTFDARDRLLSETLVVGLDDATSDETDDLITRYVYNDAGDLLETIDPRGNSTRQSYNQYGQPLTVTDLLGNTTHNNFDQRGLLRSITDPLGNAVRLDYDTRGNVTGVRNASELTMVTQAYNQYGEVTSATPVAGRTMHFDYTTDGDPAAAWYFDSSSGSTVQVLNRTQYDNNGRAVGNERFELPEGQFVTQDVAGAVIADQYRQSATSTGLNAAGQIVSQTDQNGLVTQHRYDLRGQLIETRQQGVDAQGQTVWMVSRTVYDAAGRAIAYTDSHVEGSTEAVDGGRTFYDGAGRVVESQRVRGIVIDIVPSSPLPPGAGRDQDWLTAVLSSPGEVVSRSCSQYDTAGRPSGSVDHYNFLSRTVYNRHGETVESRRQSLDQHGQKVWLVNRTVYDSLGRGVLQTDSYLEGSSDPIFGTQTIYDSLGRAAETVRRSGIQVALDGNETRVTDWGSELYRSQTFYDAEGRVVRTVAPDGQTNRHEYDSLGRQTATIGHPLPVEEVGIGGYPAGTLVSLRTETVYDSAGQVHQQRTNLRQLTLPDGSTPSTIPKSRPPRTSTTRTAT
jgi:YD repeat-containing protein